MSDKTMCFAGPSRGTRFQEWITEAKEKDPKFEVRGYATNPGSITVMFDSDVLCEGTDTE